MADFGADARVPNRLHDLWQLREHQIVDAPVRAAGGLDPDLFDQKRTSDLSDAAHEGHVDIEDVLIEHGVGLERLDLRKQDLLRGHIEARAQPHQRPQDRFRGRGEALRFLRPAMRWTAGSSSRRRSVVGGRPDMLTVVITSQRVGANARPDDGLREAIQNPAAEIVWIASSLRSSQR
jgi:hypothetical protein